MKHLSTAILVFTQHSDQEIRRKKWRGADHVTQHLINKWNQKALELARSTGLPVLISSDLIDHKGSFHEQISRAFNSAFELGYNNLLCIGNDCPGLNKTILETAATALESGKTVLGPDHRGGIYLLGIDKKTWNSLSGAHIPWQEQELFDQLCHLISQKNTAYLLCTLNDIHSSKGIKRCWIDGELSLSELISWQQILSSDESSPQDLTFIRNDVFIFPVNHLRGPPIAALSV